MPAIIRCGGRPLFCLFKHPKIFQPDNSQQGKRTKRNIYRQAWLRKEDGHWALSCFCRLDPAADRFPIGIAVQPPSPPPAHLHLPAWTRGPPLRLASVKYPKFATLAAKCKMEWDPCTALEKTKLALQSSCLKLLLFCWLIGWMIDCKIVESHQIFSEYILICDSLFSWAACSWTNCPIPRFDITS